MWIRYLKFLEKAFVFAVLMILLGVLTTSVFALKQISDQDGPGPDIKPINKSSYWNMVGFAFFMFEGIGCLLPVQREAAKPELFPTQTVLALVSLCTFYTLFSFLCYYSWGSDLDESVVTEMLPADNVFVQIMKLLFCVNLMVSYPLTIVPALTIFDTLFGKKETNSDEEVSQRYIDPNELPTDIISPNESAPEETIDVTENNRNAASAADTTGSHLTVDNSGSRAVSNRIKSF